MCNDFQAKKSHAACDVSRATHFSIYDVLPGLNNLQGSAKIENGHLIKSPALLFHRRTTSGRELSLKMTPLIDTGGLR